MKKRGKHMEEKVDDVVERVVYNVEKPTYPYDSDFVWKLVERVIDILAEETRFDSLEIRDAWEWKLDMKIEDEIVGTWAVCEHPDGHKHYVG